MSLRRNAAAALVACAALTLTGSVAVADAPARGPARTGPTALVLTLEHPAPGADLPALPARSVTLGCDPVGGTHPDPRRACADLAESAGAVEVPSDRACTLLYAPVVATVAGTWHGRPLRWQRRYGNDCELHVRTRSLFRF